MRFLFFFLCLHSLKTQFLAELIDIPECNVEDFSPDNYPYTQVCLESIPKYGF